MTTEEYVYLMTMLDEETRLEFELELAEMCMRDDEPLPEEPIDGLQCPCCMSNVLQITGNVIWCSFCDMTVQYDPGVVVDPLEELRIVLCRNYEAHSVNCRSRPLCFCVDNHLYMRCNACQRQVQLV